jgi:heme/copper-type cytochrome/quinol oxidase subunit 1
MSLARCTFWACKECHGDTYLLEMGWGLNVFTSATRGQAATANPWDAGTLEWATEILTTSAASHLSRMASRFGTTATTYPWYQAWTLILANS